MNYAVLRETNWIKQWQTPSGNFIDSKYRSFSCAAGANEFLAAWATADPDQRRDLQIAWRFFPCEWEDQIVAILKSIEKSDPASAARMKADHFGPDAELTSPEKDFLRGLGEFLDKTAAPLRPVGENQWFRAYLNDAGFQLETKLEFAWQIPSRQQFLRLLEQADSLPYRRVIKLVAEQPYLIHPPDLGQPAL